MTDPVIDIHNISKNFGSKKVVDDISLKVPRGSLFGFLGANGSGKTTTIRMICGLLTPTSGNGMCLGYDILSQSLEIKTKIGYMSQKFSFYTGLTVYENLKFTADVYQIAKPKQVINQIIEDLELDPYRNMKASGLSGGWKQRLALACCLLHKPELLFLDEPTAGVDPKARKDFWDYLHKISVRDGTTILVTTHYMDEAEKCTELAYINLGKLLYSGTNKDLIPFSRVKAFKVEADRNAQVILMEIIKNHFPKVLASFVNNDLRISSKDHMQLQQLVNQQNGYIYKEIQPNFEEVFIGLIPS